MESLSQSTSEAILRRNELGHLACFSPAANRSYVMPISYRYSGGSLYFACLPGQKLAYLTEHPEGVCFEVDEVDADQTWSTVLVTGTVTRPGGLEEAEQHMAAVKRVGRGPLRALFEPGSPSESSGRLVLCALRPERISGRRDRWTARRARLTADGASARAQLRQLRAE